MRIGSGCAAVSFDAESCSHSYTYARGGAALAEIELYCLHGYVFGERFYYVVCTFLLDPAAKSLQAFYGAVDVFAVRDIVDFSIERRNSGHEKKPLRVSCSGRSSECSVKD